MLAAAFVAAALAPASRAATIHLLGIEEGGNCQAIAAADGYSYAGYARVLVIRDTSTPAAPVRLSTMLLPGNARGLAAAGGYVYGALGPAGFCVVDATDPTAPQVVATIPLAGAANGIFLAGSLAYVADGAAGLRVIDVAVPSSPTEVGFLNTPGAAKRVWVDESFAFVADGAGGVRIINIAAPTSPSEVSHFATPGLAQDVVVRGGYAYVSDTSIGLRVLNVVNKALPAEVASASVYSPSAGIAVSGTKAYLLGGSLNIIDINDPTNPTWQDSQSLSIGMPDEVVMVNGYAYVANGVGGMVVADVSVPELVAQKGGWGTARGVCVSGDYAYIGSDHDQLQIVDVSGPVPFLAGHGAWGLSSFGPTAKTGDYCYVSDINGWHVWDVSNPGSVAYVQSANDPAAGLLVDAEVSGDYIFAVKASFGLRVYDISDPTTPYAIGYFGDITATSVQVDGGVAYLSDNAVSSGFHVLDVTSPSLPSEITEVATPGEAVDVALVGAYLYVADQGNAVLVYDVANPSSPAPVASITSLTAATAVAVSGNVLYAFDSSAGLVAFDVSDPTAPAELDSYAYDPSGTVYLAPAGYRAVLVDAYNGLLLFDITGVTAVQPQPGAARAVLEQNVPNPFNPTTRITFSVPRVSLVNLRIYDVAGRRVRTLIEHARVEASAAREVEWDGRDDAGRAMPSGIYFYELRTERESVRRKMVLLK